MKPIYRVEVSKRAQKDLDGIEDKFLPAIEAAMDELKSEPRGTDAKKLKAAKGIYSKRAGNYRILFTIDEQAKVVTIERVGDRKDIYRNFP